MAMATVKKPSGPRRRILLPQQNTQRARLAAALLLLAVVLGAVLLRRGGPSTGRPAAVQQQGAAADGSAAAEAMVSAEGGVTGDPGAAASTGGAADGTATISADGSAAAADGAAAATAEAADGAATATAAEDAAVAAADAAAGDAASAGDAAAAEAAAGDAAAGDAAVDADAADAAAAGTAHAQQAGGQAAGGGGAQLPPDVQVKAHVPAWAEACTNKPCHYMQLKSGSVNHDYPFSGEYGEDAWLANYLFWEKRNGFYLEIGAMNGVEASNTLWLHKAANWTGVLVEADAELAAALFEQRPESLTVNAAVCSDFKTVHWKGGGRAGGIVEFMSEKFKQEHHPDLGDASQLPEVACVPLQYLLGIWGIAEADFMSIDVGGAELEVLQSADLAQLKVRVILVQTDGSNPDQDRAAAELLAGFGFEPVRKPNDPPASEMGRVSSVYVHRDAWPELAHSPHIAEVVIE